MGKNKFARKLCAGFALLIMVMSVFSVAVSVSATDVDTNSNDLAIIEGSKIQNAGFGEGEDPKPSLPTSSQSQGLGAYSHESDLLKITVGEQSSSGWNYQYDPVNDPGNFIRSVYGEHYAVATDTWSSVKRSYDFTIDNYFGSEEAPDTATLHHGNLSLTRQVDPPEGSARSFSITFVLTNTGDSTLENVRFFQGIDYDIYDAENDYAWYAESSDTVWQNDDNYFKNGFHGSRTSSHHDCNGYTSMWSDMNSGNLNDRTKYPESGTADCGIALQWDAGNMAPHDSWDLTITFYFGEAAGIEANAGPDQTVGRGQPVTFDASGSSSVSTITTYEWDFDNDGVYNVSVGTPIYVYEKGWTELGEYIVGLRVTDDEGRNDTDTVKITVVPNVDLIVSNITFTPVEISDGDILIFNATVENIGTEAFTDDFYVRFGIDGSYIGRQRVSGGLSPGGSVHVLQNWEAEAGNHTLCVYADRGYYSSENSLIPETNETNNTLSQVLPEIPFPDLTITNLVWSPTEGIGDGDTVTFIATINNTGTGNTTSDFYVRFAIDDGYIGYQRVSGLTAGGSTEVSQSWHADAGTHTVKAVVDYYNEINESNENNNELSQALPEIPFPDLTITDISWSPATDIKHGDTVTFTATIENIEDGNTSSNFYVRFEIDDSYIGHRRVSGLTAGSSTEVTQSWEAEAGTHTVKAIVDEYDSVNESIETNNEKSEVLPAIPQPPQVTVTAPNGGEVWYGAQDITWEATSPEGLDLTMKIELYNGYSYKLIADGLPNTGTYQNWDTAKFADGSSVPDGTYYKIRITATDTAEVSGSDLSDNWFTIWNMPIVQISSAPYSQTTTESVNATYYLTIVNKQPSADTFDLSVDNTDDNAAVAELSQSSIALDPWESGTVTLNITDETSSTYRVTVSAVSQTNASITDEVTITTCVRNAFTIAVSAPKTQTSIGGNLTYEVEIANNQGTSDTFTLTVTEIEGSWCSMVSSCQLTAGGTKTIPLAISIPDTASASEFSLTIQVTSSNLGTTRETSAPLNVSADPLIFDLTPANNTHTGADEVLFCWRTSVTSTSDVFIKAEGEADYTLVSNESGISHAVPVSDLSRDTWYNFYVRSNSTHGSATSEVRSIFIDNGIAFSQRNYEFTIERNYNQERTITIINTDDEPHEVLLNVSGVPEDLALNFVGEGSMDQVISLHPGESKDIAIAFHAQDAQVEDYTILFNLTNLGAEEITDFANLKLHVHFPVINFTIEEISSDPHTLAKTIRVSNTGDPLTDLIVSASDELSSILMFQPSIDHAYLGTGRSIEFEAIPVLSEDFTGASGTINASAAGEEQNLSVDFSCSDGKQIFIGTMPDVSINFTGIFDSDDSPNTNPSEDELVESYLIDGKIAFVSQIVVDVYQDNVPVVDANVSLRLLDSMSELVLYSTSDMSGKAMFTIYGPKNYYSYQAELVGYGVKTEVRNFSVNSTPLFEISPYGISWVSVSDSNSTFTIDTDFDYNDSIILDSAPFAFKAEKETMDENPTAFLYLRWDKDPYKQITVPGITEDNMILFETSGIPIGNYSVAVVYFSSSGVALSKFINVSCTDEYAIYKQQNYSFWLPFPVNSTYMITLDIDHNVISSDPKMIFDLHDIKPKTNNSEYLFTYAVVTNETMTRDLSIEVRDEGGTILYENASTISLEADIPKLINITIPVYHDDGSLIEEFNVTTSIGESKVVLNVDPVLGYIYEKRTWVGADWGIFEWFWKNPWGVAIKCGAGVVFDVASFGVGGWVLDGVDLAHSISESDLLGATSGTVKKGAGEYLGWAVKQPVRKGFKHAGKWIPVVGSAAGCILDWHDVYKEQKATKIGLTEKRDNRVHNCINHAPLTTRFGVPSTIRKSLSPVQNVEGVFVTAYFPRSVPASYQPFDTIIMLNGHEIGRISDAVPQGYYTFEADPSILNYADAGVAENTITLNVEGMNRGYYVPLEGYKVDILFKKLAQAVCAASQAEADQIVANLSSAMTHKADFAVCPADIKFSDPQPSEGEEVTIEATIYNIGSFGISDVTVGVFVDDIEIDSLTIIYLPAFSTETLNTTWTATEGTHNIQVKVNPDQEINESDYTNNEASKTITVTAPDTTLPVISNPQPPDGSTTSDNTPLISADLADPDSGINTTAVRITVDDFDITQNATVISSRVWYTPEHALVTGVHNVSVYAEDNKGNNDLLDWSFTVAAENQTPVASFTYSPENPVVNETISFNASDSFDADGTIVNYEWDFGDGDTGTGEVITHSYSSAVDYTVNLTVTDNDGATNTTSKVIRVASAAIIYVNPGESIQAAVNAASDGDTIIINPGVYTENVVVNKSITIEGVGMPTVSVPPASYEAVFTLDANSVTIRGLKILDGNDGITTGITDDHLIEYNIFDNNGYGMYISSYAGPSNNNVIRHNHFINSVYDGIQMFESGEGNLFYNNTFQNNTDHDLWLGPFITGNNQVYHNNFMEGGKCTDETNNNMWYNGTLKEGNYWGDYNGTDSDGNGIGDMPYNISGVGGAKDLYPLMSPYKPTAPSVFYTGPGTYPSISGTHEGKITPSNDVTVSKIFTHPCSGTGGHSEYVRIGNVTWNVTATWTGYSGDWHNLTFDSPFVLEAGKTYDYEIRTGSYPQIIHESSKEVTGGTINCTLFTDANGNTYDNWIPAIRLE